MVPSTNSAIQKKESGHQASFSGSEPPGPHPVERPTEISEQRWRLIAPPGALPAGEQVRDRGSWLVRVRQGALLLFACIGVAGTLTFLLLILRTNASARLDASQKETLLGPPEQQERPDLGLRVQSDGERLLITWNREASSVRNAKLGLLTIEDGTRSRSIELSAEQVANGSILYRQHSEDVTFRLEVANENGPLATGLVRVLGSLDSNKEIRSVSTPQLVPAAKVTSAEKIVSAEDRPGSFRTSLPAPAQAEAPKTEIASLSREAPLSSASGSERQAVPVESSPATPPVIDDPALPEVDKVSNLLTVPAPRPIQDTSTAPDASVQAGTSWYTFPKPLREISPKLPPTQSEVTQLIVVSVTVHIDERGRVTNVHFSNNSLRITPPALLAIAQAAGQWQFSPALLRGKPVPSDFQIAFRIHPEH